MHAYPVFQFCASIRRQSRRIGTGELHEGAIFSTLFDLLTAIGLYIYIYIYLSTCEKITHPKSHVELSAKRASVQHACVEKLTYFYICLLKIRHARAEKTHLARPTFISEC